MTQDHSPQIFGKSLHIRDNLIDAILLKPQNAKGHALSLQPQSNKMHRPEYRTTMEDTTPVFQRAEYSSVQLGPNKLKNLSLKNCPLKWNNSSLILCKYKTQQHIWQEVSPDVLYLIYEEKPC